MASPTKRSSMQRALRARDDGLRTVSVVTRVLIAGTIASTALFTSLAARAVPGRPKVAAAVSPAQTATAGTIGADAGTDTNLSPPAAAPTPSYQYASPVVVSGAS